MTAQQSPKVAILLCTYQGQQYLHEQLNSFVSQTHKNWELWVSDDGSKDGTHAILDEAVKDWAPGKISLHNGPQEGFCANFLSLTCNACIKACRSSCRPAIFCTENSTQPGVAGQAMGTPQSSGRTGLHTAAVCAWGVGQLEVRQ